MESIKYLAFYTLLLIVLVLGILQKTWLVIIPAALILSVAYIVVKGKTWRQLMGKRDMSTGVVFMGVFVSQLVVAAIFFVIGRLLAILFN